MSKKISADSDLHCTLSPPPSLTNVGDKHGTHYASTGDIRQSDGKKGRGGGRPETIPGARNMMMEKELILSQNRKLQGEINTLQTENKLLKEKYNRMRDRIAEIENEMQVTEAELEKLLETSNQEIIELTNSSRLANQKDKEQFQSKISALAKENESFKLETASLEKQIESYKKLLDSVHHAGEKSKLLEAQKAELIAVKEQLGLTREQLEHREQHLNKEEEQQSETRKQVQKLTELKDLLQQQSVATDDEAAIDKQEQLGLTREQLEHREQHLNKEEEQQSETRKQVQKLTELKDLLQQQSGATDDEAVIDKQIQSLEKRLKVTEERLYQERADRANNLSQVEEKLLAENAQFQVIESDLSRKLQREKEKNRNLEKNIKDLREEIEKLHLALPFDESLLTLKKGNSSIPYSSHSSMRAESLRSNDMNHIMAQIKKEDGLGAGQEQDIIRELWNKRKLAYMQLHELEIQLVELGISDNIAEGLKNLRDNYGQAETKIKQMEERLSDMQFEMAALENTYKQQLTALVHERHDAFARLKTAEDLLEAVKTENQSLKLGLTGSQSATARQNGSTAGRNAQSELLRSEIQSLGGHLEQVISRNNLLEGELKMVNVQLNSQNQALQESKEELDLLYASLIGNEASNSQKQKIDRLSTQVDDLNTEIAMLNDRNNTLLSEKEKLEDTLAAAREKEISLQKIKQQQKANIAQIEDLQEKLIEKEHKIENQKWQLNELDGQLQKVRQDLYRELEHTDELETEVDSLQQTVTQRAQMFETLIGSEQEQLAQMELLKDTLDSVSKKLDQKKAKVSSLELNLSLSKNRVEDLERDLKELRQERSYDTKFHPPPQSSMGDRLRIRELEGERTTLKHEMAQLHSSVQLTKEQTYQAQKEFRQLESELVKAKTTILQLTAEKHELEQHLEQIAEENDSLIQERGQTEEDLVKLEKKLQEILEKFEQEARKQHGNFETRYVNIPADSRKLLNELDSLRLLLEGKEREAEMIQDRSMRQQMEVNFLQKKVELIQNQMISNREDIARMVNELANKMKEAVRTREINQFLVHERAKLQTKNYHLEKGLKEERETKVQMKKEIEEITKKIEMSQVQSKNTNKEAQDKDKLIATMEADLRNATRNLTHLELEVNQQKKKIEHLNNDVKNLAKINSTLEKRLETEKNTNQSQSYHEECEQLKEEVAAHKSHVDILRGQVLLGKDDLEKLKQEKEALRHEYEVLCRQLNDKENELVLHREESLHKLDSIKRELNEEKTTLENNKTLLEKELDFTRSEFESLKEKLHHKEIQLQSFVKTLQELEVVTREKREMEANVQRLEGLVKDNKVILDGQRKEIMVHMEANSKHQEMLAKAEMTNQKLYGELRVQQENSQHEINQLKITIKELHSQHEAERSALSESLSQSQSQLQSSQSHLALAADARDKLQGRVRILERDLEEIKSKLSDESTGRHLTEHSVGSLRLQLEDTRNQKIVVEARLNEMEKVLAKTESQLKVEKKKLKKLSGRIQETEITKNSTESSVKAKQEQVDLLQNENSKLRQMFESQKQNLISKMKMTTMDIQQQLEMVQNERDKMSSQMQKLLIDLEQSREQIAMKNKENYKQQEEILALEDQVKECKFKLKAAEDSLKTETAVQDQLTHRFAEQEEELKVLKNFLAKKAEEAGDADKAMWHEMNHVIQELSRQMQSHLDSQKQNKDARETPTQTQKLKRQIMDLQGELATERSLHQITRDSLQALEEDCKRLRHQLHVLRRRESSVSDKKYKNRMEAINAIIAKSQSQAQALLATGGYHDDINNPIYSPRMGYRSQSPRMGYSSPQRAFSPDNSVTSEFSIASTGPMIPTFESSAPHTSQGRRN
ncbi:hypothetical protein CHS0354_030835 [Potamilus streckersoni]|uniref:Uncharacterized protein n=1 Tax=Potamilus streckersoni TaxID=2493646 RepID=A0AAE0TEE3_9BIVA|nr:hypothetical protein CHS0354_030835 [Potamilus streckersoni]